jgi:hypothetical protein
MKNKQSFEFPDSPTRLTTVPTNPNPNPKPKDFMDRLIGTGEAAEVAKNFIQCSAGLAIRKPHIRQTRMPIYYGEEGAGKGGMCKLLQKMFGEHVCKIVEDPRRDLFGQFNAILAKYNVIFLDDIDKDTFGKLNSDGDCTDGKAKGTLSGTQLTINEKGKGQYSLDSYTYFAGGCTNFPRAIPRGRRYFNIPVNNVLKKGAEYRKTFYETIENEEFSQHIYWHLYYYSEERPNWHWDDEVATEVNRKKFPGYHPCIEFVFNLMEMTQTYSIINNLSIESFAGHKWTKGGVVKPGGGVENIRLEIELDGSSLPNMDLWTILGERNSGWIGLDSVQVKTFRDYLIKFHGLALEHFPNSAKIARWFDDAGSKWNNVVVHGNGSTVRDGTKQRLLKINLTKVRAIYNQDLLVDTLVEEDPIDF